MIFSQEWYAARYPKPFSQPDINIPDNEDLFTALEQQFAAEQQQVIGQIRQAIRERDEYAKWLRRFTRVRPIGLLGLLMLGYCIAAAFHYGQPKYLAFSAICFLIVSIFWLTGRHLELIVAAYRDYLSREHPY